MISGKSILMPNTAIAIPRVKNLFCRFGVISLSTVALTTAFSNDRETSNIHKMITIKTVCNQLGICNALPAQRKNAKMIATMVKMIEPLKCFIAYVVYKNYMVNILYSILLDYFTDFFQ